MIKKREGRFLLKEFKQNLINNLNGNYAEFNVTEEGWVTLDTNTFCIPDYGYFTYSYDLFDCESLLDMHYNITNCGILNDKEIKEFIHEVTNLEEIIGANYPFNIEGFEINSKEEFDYFVLVLEDMLAKQLGLTEYCS